MTKSELIEYWRSYFRATNADIFEIMEHAILVAASDCPEEFGLRRDGIAELLFSCRLARCLGCNGVELAEDGGDGGCKAGVDDLEMNVNEISHISFGEAEALTAEIEQANQTFEEVLRIRDVLNDSQEQSVSTLYECLRRLQLMDLTLDTFEETKIGVAVNGLRQHSSKDVRNLARTLINGWKALVNEWVIATKDNGTKNVQTKVTEERTPDSINPSVLDEEEGLPLPPMDAAFFATQHGPLELSQIFDGFDDDGNLLNKNCRNRRKPTLRNTTVTIRKQQSPNETIKDHQMKKQGVNTDSGPGRPPKPNVQQKSDKDSIVTRPLSGQQNKSKSCSDEAEIQAKLEATTRKLHESYQQAENAKRQRTTQFMDFVDLPKRGTGPKHSQAKHSIHNRTRVTGR